MLLLGVYRRAFQGATLGRYITSGKHVDKERSSTVISKRDFSRNGMLQRLLGFPPLFAMRQHQRTKTMTHENKSTANAELWFIPGCAYGRLPSNQPHLKISSRVVGHRSIASCTWFNWSNVLFMGVKYTILPKSVRVRHLGICGPPYYTISIFLSMADAQRRNMLTIRETGVVSGSGSSRGQATGSQA